MNALSLATSAPFLVIPAKAGIQAASLPVTNFVWIPAFAGMTERGETHA